MSVNIEQSFTESLRRHIDYVREAGDKLGVPSVQLGIHDQSKWSMQEFPYYARHFFGDKADPDGFARAWLNHIHLNPHHWQNWMYPDNFTPKNSSVEDGVLKMPEVYVREMVADWMGASKEYTGSWNMLDWLNDNLHKIQLHSMTWDTLRRVLHELGYHCHFDKFANRFEVSQRKSTSTPPAIKWG